MYLFYYCLKGKLLDMRTKSGNDLKNENKKFMLHIIEEHLNKSTKLFAPILV